MVWPIPKTKIVVFLDKKNQADGLGISGSTKVYHDIIHHKIQKNLVFKKYHIHIQELG